MQTETSFARLVRAELARAKNIHPAPIHSAHEGASILLEELDEFREEFRKPETHHKPGHPLYVTKAEQMLRELVHIAATAQRTAEDLSLLQPE